MRIAVIGGGPAGLYFSLLMKATDPSHEIEVYERNKADDTFGFGVVFSDETLGNFRDADAETYYDIIASFAYWDAIDVHYQGEMVRSRGHGFCGFSRFKLLEILQKHCALRDVAIKFEHEVPDLSGFVGYDLIVVADGANSFIRDQHADQFKPDLDWRKNKFVWLGSTLPLDTFTFIFRENGHGMFRVHAYQYEPDRSTFIIECTEATWRRARLDEASEDDTVAYCEKLFAPDLKGHTLLKNRSLWRTFPTVRNAHWYFDNVVLMGDALHTAHFSIGSGTKLAMEDAIALHDAICAHGSIAQALPAYEAEHAEETARIQRSAQPSLEWFEDTERYMGLEPLQFTISLLSRSKRITYENLKLRDADLIATIDRWFARKIAAETGLDVPTDPPPPPMFTPFKLRDMVLRNRVVVSPMCQYSAKDGMPDDWHLVHLGSRALGGAGLVYTEMTNISAEARISPGCTGIYSDAHTRAWKRIVDFVHGNSGAKICMQIGHAGRKGSTRLSWDGIDEPLPEGNWPIVSASPIPYNTENQVPAELDRAGMDHLVEQYLAATRRAEEAGFDMIELHMAHGYLLACFISPLTNKRSDAYGGSVENRMRFPLEVFTAMRAIWPQAKPMAVRISACDWVEGGITGEDTVAIARLLKAADCDLIDVSTGQTHPAEEMVFGRMFQVPFADRIRIEAGIATLAVGAITSGDQINTIVASGRADLCALARPHLADPYFTLHACAHYGYRGQDWPVQYLSGIEQSFFLAERENQEAAELRDAAAPEKPQFETREAAE